MAKDEIYKAFVSTAIEDVIENFIQDEDELFQSVGDIAENFDQIIIEDTITKRGRPPVPLNVNPQTPRERNTEACRKFRLRRAAVQDALEPEILELKKECRVLKKNKKETEKRCNLYKRAFEILKEQIAKDY